MLFLDNISALQLLIPAVCSVTMCMSYVATKNRKDLRRCIKVLSLEEPLMMASNQAKVVTLEQCGVSSKERPPNCSTQ